MPSPVFLEGERVTLHPVEEDDAEFLQRLVNDQRIRRGIGATDPVSMVEEREYVESVGEDDGAQFLVRVDAERVGTIGLHDITPTNGNGEIGYFFAPEAWGNGYATDATRTVTQYAFEERRLHKVYARAFAFNDASQRVLEKVGFEQEGRHRDRVFVDGEYVDVYRYGVLADEWDDN
ncbi:MAG: GNAT family protein [Haloarculaceae archaeon]